MKIKWVSIGIISLLAVALIAAGIFLSSINTQRSLLVEQKATLESQAFQLQKEVRTLEMGEVSLKGDLAISSQEIEAAKASLTQLNDEKKALEEQIKKLTADNATQKTTISDLKVKNTDLNDQLMCEDKITNVTFTDNSTVNKALVDYVNRTKNMDENISVHNWNTVWTSSKYAIHTIAVLSEKDNTNYLWKFTVYYKGEAYGLHKNGIFYNDHQCWLYLEK